MAAVCIERLALYHRLSKSKIKKSKRPAADKPLLRCNGLQLYDNVVHAEHRFATWGRPVALCLQFPAAASATRKIQDSIFYAPAPFPCVFHTM
jgi:hypothetical protein